MVIFSRAAEMLAKADTIQKAKELKDMAIVAKEWAERRDMGKEAIQHCRSYALEAERRMGQILKQTERNKGAKGQGKVGCTDGQGTPTLKELGIKNRESSDAQFLADLSESAFLSLKLAKTSVREYRRQKRTKDRKKAAVKRKIISGVRKGKFQKVLIDVHKINAIITDPPYGKKALQQWRELGEFAAERLCDNGVLLAYSGQMYFPDILALLSENLDYFWTLAVFHEGTGNMTPLSYPIRKVINQWKPIVCFCKKGCGYKEVFRDVIRAAKPDKKNHNWSQSVCESEWLIEQFTVEGELVVDPFAGSGTVGLAAKNKNRKFIGAEIL